MTIVPRCQGCGINLDSTDARWLCASCNRAASPDEDADGTRTELP